jgi:hypothetical protein
MTGAVSGASENGLDMGWTVEHGWLAEVGTLAGALSGRSPCSKLNAGLSRLRDDGVLSPAAQPRLRRLDPLRVEPLAQPLQDLPRRRQPRARPLRLPQRAVQ